MQEKWVRIAGAMVAEDPQGNWGVTHVNAKEKVRRFVEAFDQQQRLSEKLTGEEEERTVLDELVEEYKNMVSGRIVSIGTFFQYSSLARCVRTRAGGGQRKRPGKSAEGA